MDGEKAFFYFKSNLFILLILYFYFKKDSLILTCWYFKRLAILLSNYHDSRSKFFCFNFFSLVQVEKWQRISSDKPNLRFEKILRPIL